MINHTRKGIIAGGNWILDQIKTIDCYPGEEQLVNILDQYISNGGSPYNVLKDLRKLDPQIPLEAIGLVGCDTRGEHIIKECSDLSIGVQQLQQTSDAATSYTDVMSVKSTGKRTFFHQRGTNALLDEPHFDFAHSNAKIFHLGYLLLLDKLDMVHPDGTTGSAQVFKKAKANGLLTSADIVSDATGAFKKVVPPALPFIDFLFINEIEAMMLTGYETKDKDGSILLDNCFAAASAIIGMGVQQWVLLHYEFGVIAIGKNGESLYQPCVKLPSEKIRGAVGAGDAFAAGVLLGLHETRPIKNCLELGVAAAAASLQHVTCSDGIFSVNQCLTLANQYGYRQMPEKTFVV